MTTTHETPRTPPTTTKAGKGMKAEQAEQAEKAMKAAAERDWFDQYLEFVHRIEAPMVRTTARMAGLVAEYVPERPAFLASLPKVHDVMATGITLRKRLVDEQTRFARQVVKAMDPMLVRVDTVHREPAHRETAHRKPDRAGSARAGAREHAHAG